VGKTSQIWYASYAMKAIKAILEIASYDITAIEQELILNCKDERYISYNSAEKIKTQYDNA
jgi:hypothetical protein